MKTTIFEERDNKGILGKSLAQEMAHGLVLAEFFEISERAKEGGMGDVFFCRDKRDNKFYVLKTTVKKMDYDLFRKECLTVLRLWKHPYIVYSKTVVFDKDKYYIVMEYVGKQPYTINEPVQGETLSRVMDKVKIEPKQALIWAIQFCQGMQFLHQAGIETHKDIKPDNILVTPENNIKIADFGLAGLDKKGGTIGYRAPEYFKEGEKLTIQSDIYSFGLVLYQMLNGGESLPNATIWDENTKEYEKIDVNNIKCEHGLDIVKKCLAEKPEDRYINFQELEEDLAQYLKRVYPEYVPVKPLPEKMTAIDYFLKGLGYYYIKEKLWAFLLLSLAIFEDPKMAEAYYYRGKISVLPLPIRMLLVMLILGLILAIPLWIYVALLNPFSHFLWNLALEKAIYILIGGAWIAYLFSKKFGWKFWSGILYLGKNACCIIFNRDLRKAQQLEHMRIASTK